MMTVVNDAQFRALCQHVVGDAGLSADRRFADNTGRVKHGPALREILGRVFQGGSRAQWVDRLRNCGVPAGSVATVKEALASDLVAARRTVRQVRHASAGAYPVLRTPARLHDTTELSDQGAPLLGEHTRDVLQTVAGLDEAEIEALLDQNAAKSSSS
jgi:crotonobetainyl-CoA:carnitine CoA-transferase CaiB-like acyl-CoA transferase